MAATPMNPGLDRWSLVAGLALGTVVSNGFARFAYGLVLPAMRADLQWTYTQAGWINTANAIGYLLGGAARPGADPALGAERLFVARHAGLTLSLLASGLT
ncbi:MAG: YbfB/YjiJ family MFS transporter [Burkholderiaceae bacterium]